MASYRCPDPSHGSVPTGLRSNNDKIYECEASHRFFRREDAGKAAFVDLISGRAFPVDSFAHAHVEGAAENRPRLNFMVDIPRATAAIDFNRLSLPPAEWKIISKVDGRSTLEEVRLLSGMKSDEAERLFYSLMDAGLIEIRKRGR